MSSAEIQELNKKYVDNQFKIVAYETGGYIGTPEKHFQYHPVSQDIGFFFEK